MEQPVFSVSELVSVVNQTLDYAYPSVVVEGEVASFKISKGKYVFFDLKDTTSVVSCFMMTYQLRLPLEDGMQVRLVAQPRLTAWGKFSLTVRTVSPVGEGTIKRTFALLQQKLAAEGLFDPTRKRSLPAMPSRVGLIASVESAGYADFIKILNHRWQGVEVLVADVQVQGASAGDQVLRAIDYFNQQAQLVEVLVIVRGGGSAEDLAVFNDELLVRAVAGSRVPTLVGVGHEVDTSLCDLAADVRAATPSNAAQILVPDKQALLAELTQREQRLAERIAHAIQTTKQTVHTAAAVMIANLERALHNQQTALKQAFAVLSQLDPAVVLRRGYALVRNKQGELVRGAATNITVGNQLTITTTHAIIEAGVTSVKRKK